MGDDQAVRSPTVDLIAQVNRFTRAGQFGGTIYRLDLASGNPIANALATITLQPTFSDAALTALLIHQTRLLVSQMAIQDAGTAAQIAAAAAATSDPVAFVKANLPMLTSSIAGFADQKGLPAADYSVTGTPADGGISPMMVVIAAGALVLYMSSKRKRR